MDRGPEIAEGRAGLVGLATATLICAVCRRPFTAKRAQIIHALKGHRVYDTPDCAYRAVSEAATARALMLRGARVIQRRRTDAEPRALERERSRARQRKKAAVERKRKARAAVRVNREVVSIEEAFYRARAYRRAQEGTCE